MNPQRRGDPPDRLDARIALTALNASKEPKSDASFMCDCLLREPANKAIPPYVLAHDRSPSHGCIGMCQAEIVEALWCLLRE